MSEDSDGIQQPKPLESNDEELARVKSESLYRIFFDNAADAIAVHDMGGKFLEVNRVLCERLGYSREELLQMTPADISSPEHAAIFQQRVETLRKSGNAFFETVHVRRDGTTIPIEVSTRLIEYKGKPAVLSFTRDITERKRAENALRQQYSMLDGIINSSDAPIFSVDRQYRYTSFNKAHAAVMKVIYGKDIEIGKSLLNYMTVAEDREEAKRNLDRALAGERSTEEAYSGEETRSRLNFEVSHSPIMEKDGAIIGVAVFARDITERKRTAEKLDAIHKHSVQLGAENSIDEIVTSTLDAMEDTLGFHYAGFEEVKDDFVQIKEARGIPASLEPLPLDGPGVVVKVARTKETIRISDTTSEPAFVDTRTKSPDGQPVRMLSELAVPVVVNGSVLAVLNVENAQLGAFTESDQVLLETLAMHVSSAIARLEQMEALRSRAEELGTLQATVLDITAPYDLSTLLERIVERAVRLIGAKGGGMYLCDPEKREARCVVSYKTPHDYRDVVLKYGEGAAGRVAETGRPLIVNDYRLWEGRAEVYEKDRPFSALLSAPMIWQDRVIGIIHVMEESKARRFTQTDLEMLMLFANHATIAVERTRTEEALRESEERFRGIAERSFDAILTVDLEGRITYASPAVERITGYSQSEMLGASFQKFLPESEIPNGIQILSEAVRGDVAKSVEANILKKDGSKVCFEFAGSPILKDGKLAGFQGIARDVTERKRMETALKESEERYRMMFRSMGDAVAVYEAVDQGNNFVFRDFNEAAERIEKIKSEDLIGRSVLEVFPGLKDLGLFEVFQRVWKTGKPEHLPAGIYKDKRVVGWRENYVYRLPSGELVAVYQDVTDRKRLEEELRQYSVHLERLVNERTKELRSAGERLEYVISSNPAAIFTGRPRPDLSDYDATYMSNTVAQMTGFQPKELIGNPEFWESRVHPDDLPRYHAEMPQFWKEGHHVFEYRFLHKDGTYRWLREEARLIHDASGKPVEVIGYGADITERRNMENALRISERRFRDLADLLPQIVFEINENGNVQFMNRAAFAAIGLSEEDYRRGLNASDMLAPAEHIRAVRGMRRIMGGEMIGEREFTVLRKDGTAFPAIVYTAPILREGKTVGLRGIAVDITDRKRAEGELRAAKEQLDYVVTSSPAVIFTGKPRPDLSNFDATYLSKSVVSLLGFEPEEYIEMWYNRVHPEDVRRYLAEVPLLWKDGRHTFEYRFLHKDGTYRWIREEAKVVRDADGKPIEVNGYWTDVSERKRLEEELANSQRLATIGETAAMVGHDLRNPLQGIAGIVYLAKRDLESRKAADRKAAAALLDTIQEQVVYMDKIVSDLQDYSQALAPKLTETNLPNLIRQTLSTINIPKAVKVTVEIEKPAENAMIDPTLMRRTLTNLTMNAIQAMPKRGKLTIRARSKRDSTVVTVEDTGAGISRKNLGKLFSPFFTTKAKGQGLGLAVCKRLVEAQGGTITVKSKPRKGTTFTIKLPRSRKEMAS